MFIIFFILLIFLGGVEERVKGFDVGVDDFIFKFIEISEMNVRVRVGLWLY